MKTPNLSLVEARILDSAVRFVERLKGVAHVPVPKPGLLLIGDAEQLPHLLFYQVCKKWPNVRNSDREVKHRNDWELTN